MKCVYPNCHLEGNKYPACSPKHWAMYEALVGGYAFYANGFLADRIYGYINGSRTSYKELRKMIIIGDLI